MRTKVTTIVLPLVFIVTLVAGIQAKSGKYSKSSGTSATVTGCLQTGSNPNTYVLNNVGSGNMHSSNMSGSSQSQTPNEMARSEGSSYTLIPQGDIDLQKWVGQRVQVTGKWATETSSSTSNPSSYSSSESHSNMGSSSSQGNNSSMSSSSSMSGMSELKVTSIRKASGTCQ